MTFVKDNQFDAAPVTGAATVISGGMKVFTGGVALKAAGVGRKVTVTAAGYTSSAGTGLTVNADALKAVHVLMPGETNVPGSATGRTGAVTDQTAGVAMPNPGMKVMAVDQYWNEVSTAVVAVTMASNDNYAVFPTGSALNVTGDKVYTDVVVLKTASVGAGDKWVRVSAAGLSSDTGTVVKVVPNAAVKLQVLLPGESALRGNWPGSGKTGAPAANTAGNVYANVKVYAVDEYWNVVPGVNPNLTWSSGTDPYVAFGNVSGMIGGSAVADVTFKRGNQNNAVSADGGGLSGVSGNVYTSPNAATRLVVLMGAETADEGNQGDLGKTGLPGDAVANTAYNCKVRVTDDWYNKVGLGTNVNLTSATDGGAVFSQNPLTVGSGGEAGFTVTFRKAQGASTVTADDGTRIANTGIAVKVNQQPAKHLQMLVSEVTPLPGTLWPGKDASGLQSKTAGVKFSVTVNAIDDYSNPSTVNSDHTVTIESTNAYYGLTIPGSSTVIASRTMNGGKTVIDVVLYAAVPQVISVRDISRPAGDTELDADTLTLTVLPNQDTARRLLVLVPDEAHVPGSQTGKSGNAATTKA
ncbi:MAG: hypothetical protein AAB368_14070, partial [bacterium]